MIEVSGLTKRYGTTLAVEDLTFNVKPGLVTGFLGPNGAGKSTTMRIMLGLDHPTRGTATFNGVPYEQLKHPLRVVGSLLDARSVHPRRTAANHLTWVAQTNGIPASRVDEVLGLVGLSEVAGKKAGEFSLGMSQRLGLAAALLGDPEFVLLDEPVNGLDPEGIRWVRTLVQSLAAEGRTVLVSSHLLAEMAQTAQHLVVIGRGRLVSDSPTDEFIRSASTSTVVVRTPQLSELEHALGQAGLVFTRQHDSQGRPQLVITGTDTEHVGEHAYRAGVVIHELSERQGSLEDAYMSTTKDSVDYRAGQSEREEN